MPPPKKDTEQVTLRVPRADLAEAERIAKTTEKSSRPWSRNDVLRHSIMVGLDRAADHLAHAVRIDRRGAKK